MIPQRNLSVLANRLAKQGGRRIPESVLERDYCLAWFQKIVYPLPERAVLRGYEEFADLPENRLLPVYSLEEITTEKTLALADRARNEPRDLYDLWHLTSNEGIELGALADAMRQKLAFREKPCAGLAEAIRAKEARLKALWDSRLGQQMAALPRFDDVFRAVQRTLRQAELP